MGAGEDDLTFVPQHPHDSGADAGDLNSPDVLQGGLPDPHRQVHPHHLPGNHLCTARCPVPVVAGVGMMGGRT